MWPTQPYRPALERSRAPLAILLVTGAVVAATAAAALWSVASARPTTSAYSTGEVGAELWTGDPAAGFEPEAVPRPGPRGNAADLAYDPSTRTTVLWDHGCARLVLGFTGGCTDTVDETWTWDGTAWSPHPNAGSPREDGPGSLFFDPQAGHVVYVSGTGRAWSWAAGRWQDLPLPPGPDLHGSHLVAAGFDQDRDRLVLVTSAATWSYDGARWTSAATAPDATDLRPDARLVDDRATRRLVYIGTHRTWTWDGDSWHSLPQPAVTAASTVFDPARGTLTLVQEDASSCDGASCATTFWTLNGSGWEQAVPPKTPRIPVARSGASAPPAAFDEARGETLLFVSGA